MVLRAGRVYHIRLDGAYHRARIAQMDDPVLLPYFWRDEGKEVGLAQGVAELGAKDGRKSCGGKQKVLSGGQPSLTIGGQATTGNEVVNVRVVAEIASPGMEDADETHLPTDKTRILGQTLDSGGRGAEEGVVENFRVGTGDSSELAGEGESEEEVGGGE